MNWLLLVVIMFMALNIVVGYKKGMLRILYSLVAWLVILVIGAWVTPHVSEFLINNTAIESKIEEKCNDKIKDQFQADDEDKLVDNFSKTMPEPIVKLLFGEKGKDEGLVGKSGLYDILSQKIARLMIDGISFVLAIIILSILFLLFFQVIKVVEKLPVLKDVNRVLGAGAGFLKGMLWIWIIFAIIAMGSTSELGNTLMSYIDDAKILSWLYNNNIVLMIIVNLISK